MSCVPAAYIGHLLMHVSTLIKHNCAMMQMAQTKILGVHSVLK